MSRQINAAVLQMAFTKGDPGRNVSRVAEFARRAARGGAEIILPPELFSDHYFCKTQDEAHFANAYPWRDHPAVHAMQAVARALSDLRAAAQAGENVMPASIACAPAGVTTGEWAAQMRAVHGEYRWPTGVSSGKSNKTERLADLRAADFIKPTNWPTIDIVPSCANAAFVEFASAQYRHLNPEWSFFAAVSRFLDQLPADAYDLILFDCPPAIGYQSMNAVFAADMLYIPSGPGYWEYDSTTSFIGQLSEALEDLSRFSGLVPAGTMNLPKTFLDLRFLLTRFEPNNDLHRAMQQAFIKVWGDRVAEHPIEMTRAVEQSGRVLSSIY